MRFAPIPLDAIADSRLSKTDFRVLAALHYFNGEQGCFPTRGKLCEATKLAPQKVSASTTRLIGFGWVEKQGRLFLLKANSHQSSDINSHQSSDTQVTEVVTKKVTDPVTYSHQSGDPNVTEVVTHNRTIEENQEQNKEENNIKEILAHLEQTTKARFPISIAYKKIIAARLADGHSPDDLKQVIEFKYRDWLGTKFAQYLRPETLFHPEKFPGYLAASQLVSAPVSATTQKNLANLSGWDL